MVLKKGENKGKYGTLNFRNGAYQDTYILTLHMWSYNYRERCRVF